MDKLHAMTLFVQIAEKGSLTAAASSSGKSLPAVVRTLASLEASLQVRLFNRTTRRIALTEEGRLYLQSCRKILSDIAEAELALSYQQIEPSGAITLTASTRFGEMYVMPALNRFLLQYPQVKVNLLLLDRVVDLLDEGVDLAVRIAPLEDSSMIAKSIGEISRVVCVSPNYLKSVDGELQHPKQLSQYSCIHCTSLAATPVWRFTENGKSLEVKVSGNFTSNQISTAVEACVFGLGFGMFLNYQVKPWLERGELLTVLQDFVPPAMPLSLVYSHARMLPTRVRVLIDWLAQELRI